MEIRYNKMKVSVLGKYGPYPALNGATSGYLVENGDTKVMLDFGCGILSRIDEFTKVEKLDAIILSHTHFDHACDLLVLSYRLKTKIKLYMPIKQEGGLAQIIKNTNAFDVIEYDETSVFDINGITVSFSQMIHPVTSFAIKLATLDKVFVYTGDTVFNDKLINFCKGANYILADAMQKEDVKNPHMTVYDASILSKEVGCPVLCSHCPIENKGNALKYDNLLEVEEYDTYEI